MNHKKTWISSFFVLIVLIVILHLSLPYWATNFLNKRLSNMGDYSGHIDDVSMSLYRGAYSLHNLKVVKVDGTKKVPFVRAELIDIAISWRALFKGAIVADLAFISPEINFVDGRSEEQGQVGAGVDWQQMVVQLAPITINQIQVKSGLIAFRNFESNPPVNMQINEIEATLTNLTNVDNGDGRVATLDVTGEALNDSLFTVNAELDPFKIDDFAVALRCEEVSLPMLNDLANAYAGFDFHAGTAELISEVEVSDGQFTGYVKPLFKDVDIFDWEQDVERQNDGPFQLAYEGLGGGLSALLTNSDTEKVATQVDIAGQLEAPEVSTWNTVKNTLSNAFIEAYNSQFEGLFKASTSEAPTDVNT